jgi:hypothetical protein
MVVDQLLPTIQPQYFMKWAHKSSEQSLVEFYTILLEERLVVALEILKAGICSSLKSPNLTRVVQRCSDLVIVLAREDVEVHVHVLQTMTEQFQMCEWGTVVLENFVIVSK